MRSEIDGEERPGGVFGGAREALERADRLDKEVRKGTWALGREDDPDLGPVRSDSMHDGVSRIRCEDHVQRLDAGQDAKAAELAIQPASQHRICNDTRARARSECSAEHGMG